MKQSFKDYMYSDDQSSFVSRKHACDPLRWSCNVFQLFAFAKFARSHLLADEV